MLGIFNLYIENFKNSTLVSLFDALGTLIQSMGENLKDEQNLQLLMQILSKAWNQIPDGSNTLLSLFECLELVFTAIGPLFEPYSSSVYQRCIKLLQGVCASFKVEH
mmetsp:Transcript_34397/g.25472  ORF Transcript_34397/g.25472 Transcript_34397/m.25472 type:complete len:107 (-) Transcript_34397:412-732(-)